MEDLIAYFILAIVILWFCMNIYKKIKGRTNDVGCSSGCGSCNTASSPCSDSAELLDRKL